MSWEDRLEELTEEWNQAQEDAKGPLFTTLEDGRYIAKLVGTDIGESQSSGRLQVTWIWEIVEGEYTGEQVRDYDGLENEQNLVYLLRKLAILGYDIDQVNVGDLEEVLEELVAAKPLCRIRLRTRGDFQNVYIDQMIEARSSSDVSYEEEEEVVEEDEAEEESEELNIEDEDFDFEDGEPIEDIEEFIDEDEIDKVVGSEEEEDEDDEIEEMEEQAFSADDMEVGQRILFDSRGKKVKGEILEIDDDMLTVERDDGRESRVGDYRVLDILEEAGAFDEEPEEIEEIDEEEDVEELISLEAGMDVVFQFRNSLAEGTIKEIDEEEDTAVVKTKEGKLLKMSPDRLAVFEKE